MSAESLGDVTRVFSLVCKKPGTRATRNPGFIYAFWACSPQEETLLELY